MTSLDDTELLRRYAAEKSEAAFAELVRRHVNPVYAFALRRVGGDAHLAARDLVRAEIRRRAREQEAQTMHDSSGADDHAKIDWEKLQPVLDETMGELNDGGGGGCRAGESSGRDRAGGNRRERDRRGVGRGGDRWRGGKHSVFYEHEQ